MPKIEKSVKITITYTKDELVEMIKLKIERETKYRAKDVVFYISGSQELMRVVVDAEDTLPENPDSSSILELF